MPVSVLTGLGVTNLASTFVAAGGLSALANATKVADVVKSLIDFFKQYVLKNNNKLDAETVELLQTNAQETAKAVIQELIAKGIIKPAEPQGLAPVANDIELTDHSKIILSAPALDNAA